MVMPRFFRSGDYSSINIDVYSHALQSFYLAFEAMDLIHYSFVLLILFRVPYMLDLLPYYLSITNGTGGVGIFEFLVFQCFV